MAGALPGGEVPAAWADELAGLPGIDGTRVRLTLDPDGAPDALFPGRAHPLTRRVVAAVRVGQAGRVSAARAALSVVATYVVEAQGLGFRRVFALRAFPGGLIEACRNWLDLTDGPGLPDDTVWDRLFAHWVSLPDLHRWAETEGLRLAGAFAASQQERLAGEEAAASAWLARRAAELCGPSAPSMPDLFGNAPAGPDWRVLTDPKQRLAAFAADAANPAVARRDAAAALETVRPRQPPLAPAVRPLGLLMLVP